MIVIKLANNEPIDSQRKICYSLSTNAKGEIVMQSVNIKRLKEILRIAAETVLPELGVVISDDGIVIS